MHYFRFGKQYVFAVDRS